MNPRRIVFAAALLVAGALPGLPQEQPALEEQIRDLVHRFNQAYLENDYEAYFSFYADDLSQWWPSGRVSLAEYKEMWRRFLDEGGRVLQNDLSDLFVQVSPDGDAAVASYQLTVVTRQPDGTLTREEVKETDVWFRRGGEWKLVHLHYQPKPVS